MTRRSLSLPILIAASLFINIRVTLLDAQEEVPTNELTCCSGCLGQSHMKGYDALSYELCSQGDGGCCFEKDCHQSTLGDYLFDSTVTYEKTTPRIASGNWIQLQWEGVDYVTYIIVNDGQEKTSQPKNSSSRAVENSGWFQLCAQNTGTVYFRGWSEAGCTASLEHAVDVVGTSSNVCSSRPASPKASAGGSCNLNRASVQDGTCVCNADWAGAPACNGYPVWKWLLTLGGGFAAVGSILVSVYTFYHRKVQVDLMASSTSSGDLTTPPLSPCLDSPPMSRKGDELTRDDDRAGAGGYKELRSSGGLPSSSNRSLPREQCNNNEITRPRFDSCTL